MTSSSDEHFTAFLRYSPKQRMSDFQPYLAAHHLNESIIGFTFPRSVSSNAHPPVDVPGKNPKHPSALRAGDLTVGRTIVVYSENHGTVGTFRILSKAFKLQIKLLKVATGEHLVVSLEMLGVIPTLFEWDNEIELDWGYTFTVDHRKRHLLPDFIPSGPVFFDPWLEAAFNLSGRTNFYVPALMGTKDSGKTSFSPDFYLRLLESRVDDEVIPPAVNSKLADMLREAKIFE